MVEQQPSKLFTRVQFPSPAPQKAKMTKEKIAILGDGGWGTTLAVLLCKKGYPVTLWGAFPNYLNYLRKKRINTKFLPGVKIPIPVEIEPNLKKVVRCCDVVVLTTPSQYVRSVLKRVPKNIIKGKIVVSAVKGIENRTLMRISELIKQVLKIKNIAILSGPTIAHEIIRSVPSTAVIASDDKEIAKKLQTIFTTETFRIYTNNDIIGTELGGSLKNIIAISCGISDGLGFGKNTKAALLTRGIVEITRLGIKLGAKKETFMGVSGLGDLITTCFSPYSRNRFVGEQLGKGKKIKQILSHMKMVAEGIPTTKSAYNLSRKLKVDMPITKEVYSILFKDKNPRKAVRDLMTRRHKQEY